MEGHVPSAICTSDFPPAVISRSNCPPYLLLICRHGCWARFSLKVLNHAPARKKIFGVALLSLLLTGPVFVSDYCVVLHESHQQSSTINRTIHSNNAIQPRQLSKPRQRCVRGWITPLLFWFSQKKGRPLEKD